MEKGKFISGKPSGNRRKVKEMDKEKRQIELSERCNIDMFEILQQPEQEQHKSNSSPDDTSCHRPGNDIIVQMTRLVPHNPLVGKEANAKAAKVSIMRFTQSI